MSDIRKRIGKKGTTYQVRFVDPTAKTGYSYESFETAKEARAFRENAAAKANAASAGASANMTVLQAVDEWLDICEKIGRDGRETVERETVKEYRRRGKVMCEYPWSKPLRELKPADCREFRDWLLRNKTRDLARRTLSSFHSVLIEMQQRDRIEDDPASGITIKADGRYQEEDSEVDIPSDREVRDILGAADSMGRKNDFMRGRWARYCPELEVR